MHARIHVCVCVCLCVYVYVCVRVVTLENASIGRGVQLCALLGYNHLEVPVVRQYNHIEEVSILYSTAVLRYILLYILL